MIGNELRKNSVIEELDVEIKWLSSWQLVNDIILQKETGNPEKHLLTYF